MTVASIASIFSDRPRSLRATVLGLALVIGGPNILAWFWALAVFHDYPVLLGTAFLAYGFGLRHAVDADHIAAIDNATRKLMQEGKRPAALGFYFALGHSTVVVVAAIAVAATAGWLRQDFPRLQEVGGVVGTGISALFLLAVAIVNLFIFAAVWKSFRRVRAGEKLGAGELDTLLAGQGFLARLFRPLFRLVTHSWHMFAVGLLFGLGFDTATEIGLLGIAASEAAHGLSLWATLVFPGALHRRHVPDRYDRQRADGRRLWLGLGQAGAQALLQPHHHLRLGDGGIADWRCRAASASRSRSSA